MNLKNLAGAVAVVLIAAFPLFAHLSGSPIDRWDESRLAATAFEMTYSDNWLVTTFNHQPDMLSLKPPLQIWLMAISIKLLGANVLAIRLPSALAALATCLFLYWFLTVKQRNRLMGIVAPALLVASEGYVRLHGTRTGDYDSLLTLFTTMLVLFYYEYLLGKGNRNILLASAALILACLTKGVAPLMMMPGLLIVTLYHKKLLPLFRTKQFYTGLVLFIIIIPGYYFLREQYNPGYLEAVYHWELGGRFLDTLDYHQQPWYHYFEELNNARDLCFVLAVPGVFTVFTSRNKDIRMLAGYTFIVALAFLVVLSCAGTKLYWYNLPAYPLLSVLGAITVRELYVLIKKQQWVKPVYLLMPVSLLFAAGFIASYLVVLNNVTKPQKNLYDLTFSMSHYLHKIGKERKGKGEVTLVYADYEQDMTWYVQSDTIFRLVNIDDLKPGDEVIGFKHETRSIIENTYDYTLLEEYYYIRRYKIHGLKTTGRSIQ